MTGDAERDAGYSCPQCGTRHAAAGIHENGSRVTPGDRPGLTRALLEAWAARVGQGLGAPDAVKLATGTRARKIDGRTRAGREQTERLLEAMFIVTDLADAGYLRQGAGNGYSPRAVEITTAGRLYLGSLRRHSDAAGSSRG